MKRTLSFLPLVAGCLAVLLSSGNAAAALLNVNITGVDVEYKGSEGKIVDDAADALNPIGNMNPALADDADLASFKMQAGTILDSWMSPPEGIFADLLIESAPASIPLNTPTMLTLSGTNEFVWWVGDGDPGNGGAYLRIEFDAISVTRTKPVPNVPLEIFSIAGTGNVIGQQLPGMSFDSMVNFVYSATDTSFSDTFGMARDGVISISGEMATIPEPTALGLAGLGLLTLVRRRRF